MQHPKSFPPLQPLSESGPGHVPLKDFRIKEQVKVMLAYAPWSSVDNLEAFLGESGLADVCVELEAEGFIAGLDVVVNQLSARRFVLSRRGVRHVTRPFHHDGQVRAALPLTWQMTEDGALRLLSWLPMIEALYGVLPTFWTGGLATPFEVRSEYPELGCDSYLWLGIPALANLEWFSRGRLHLSATWRFYRPDRQDRYVSVPFFWSGLLPQEDFNNRSLRLGSPFIRSLHTPGDYVWDGLAPVVIAVGVDEFSAWRARWAYGADVKVASLDPAASLVWSAEASESEWTLEDTRPAARVIGYPENAVGAQGVEVLNFGGIREHRLFHFIAQFRAATRAHLVRAFHMSRGAVREVVELLKDRGLVMEVDGHLYVTQAGLQMLAARDRIDVGRLVEVSYEDPEGEVAVRERIHDAAVAEAAAHFLAKGLAVAAGWRWLVSWGEGKDEGQLVPDLWVRIPGPWGGAWVPVEVEFSATTRGRIEERKLRSYRLALEELHMDYPIIVIAGEQKTVKVFEDAAGGLTIFATTLRNFRTDVWEGPQSVWQHRGETVDLHDIAAKSRVHLLQNTGLKVETSAPPVDIWVAMHRREYIWEDPVTEGWQWDGLREDVSGEGTGPAGGGPTTSPTPPAPPSAVRPVASGSKPAPGLVRAPAPTCRGNRQRLLPPDPLPYPVGVVRWLTTD